MTGQEPTRSTATGDFLLLLMLLIPVAILIHTNPDSPVVVFMTTVFPGSFFWILDAIPALLAGLPAPPPPAGITTFDALLFGGIMVQFAFLIAGFLAINVLWLTLQGIAALASRTDLDLSKPTTSDDEYDQPENWGREE